MITNVFTNKITINYTIVVLVRRVRQMSISLSSRPAPVAIHSGLKNKLLSTILRGIKIDDIRYIRYSTVEIKLFLLQHQKRRRFI